MKRFIIVWVVLMALISTALIVVAQDADVSLFVSCIENPSESGLPRVWFGYSASATVSGAADYGPLDGVGFIGDPPNTLQAGRHDRIFAAELQTEGVTAFFEFIDNTGKGYSVTADAGTKAPKCGAAVWHPGAPSIAVDVTSDCAFVEIRDAYGHWSRVADAAHPDGILLHYGEQLIGGPNQSTDAGDYRAVATACF
jgi:hypothetical protein